MVYGSSSEVTVDDSSIASMGQNVTSHLAVSPSDAKLKASRGVGSRSEQLIHRRSSPYRPVPIRVRSARAKTEPNNEHSFAPYTRTSDELGSYCNYSLLESELKMSPETTAGETRERNIRSAAMYSQLLTNYCIAHSCFVRARENLTSSLGELQQFRESAADVKAYFAGPILDLLDEDYSQILALDEASHSSEELRQAKLHIQQKNSEIFRLKAELEALKEQQPQDAASADKPAADSKIKSGLEEGLLSN